MEKSSIHSLKSKLGADDLTLILDLIRYLISHKNNKIFPK